MVVWAEETLRKWFPVSAYDRRSRVVSTTPIKRFARTNHFQSTEKMHDVISDTAIWNPNVREALGVRSEVNSELNFPPNFEGLVLGCIDADFCK